MPPEQSVEIVVAQPTALAQMERIQIDSQIATAKQYPRDTDMFIEKSIKMVTCDIETAESCHYRRPVGKKGNQVEYAEGPSVRMAEIVMAAYGNIKIQCMITEMEPRQVKAIARVLDMENNIAVEAECVESTVTKDGKPFSERMRMVVAKACMAKARRDALFMVIPRSLCKPIIAAAEKVASGGELPMAERRSRVAGWIVGLGIDPNRVWKALGVQGLEELEDEHFMTLFGIRTSLKDTECTIDDAFPAPQSEAIPKTAGSKSFGKKKPAEEEPEEVKDVTESEEIPDTEVEEEVATDGQGDMTLPEDFDENDVGDGPDPTPSGNDAKENQGSTKQADSDAKSSTTPGPTDEPKYTCQKCKGSNIKIKEVGRAKTPTPFCMTCISGKNVVELQ